MSTNSRKYILTPYWPSPSFPHQAWAEWAKGEIITFLSQKKGEGHTTVFEKLYQKKLFYQIIRRPSLSNKSVPFLKMELLTQIQHHRWHVGSSLTVFGQTRCKAYFWDNWRHLNTAWTLNEMKLVEMECWRVPEKRHKMQYAVWTDHIKDTAHMRGRTHITHIKVSTVMTSA